MMFLAQLFIYYIYAAPFHKLFTPPLKAAYKKQQQKNNALQTIKAKIQQEQTN